MEVDRSDVQRVAADLKEISTILQDAAAKASDTQHTEQSDTQGRQLAKVQQRVRELTMRLAVLVALYKNEG